jgi:hypothetical protein
MRQETPDAGFHPGAAVKQTTEQYKREQSRKYKGKREKAHAGFQALRNRVGSVYICRCGLYRLIQAGLLCACRQRRSCDRKRGQSRDKREMLIGVQKRCNDTSARCKKCGCEQAELWAMKNRKVAAWVLVALVGCAASVSLGEHAQGGPAQGVARDDAASLEAALKKVAPQAERVTQGRIESVTVYRGQALVTRMVDASTNGSAVQEVIVTNLPNRIVPESLHAEGLGGAAVRSVRFRTRPVEQDTREGVRALDEQIEEVAIKIESCKRQIELIAEHRAYLTSLQQFVAPTATTELSKGVLNAQTIEQLSGNLRSQRKEMAEEELKLQSQARMHERSLELLRRQRDELTRGASTTVLEAVVLVARAQDTGSAAFKLRYLVNDATWEPSYTLRAAKEGVALEYFASIAQMSGEDWGDARMTLSTATPSLVASAPVLAPLAYVDAVRSLEQQRSEVVLQRMQAIKTELGEGVRVGAANEAAGKQQEAGEKT